MFRLNFSTTIVTLASILAIISAANIEQTWVISYGQINPDGVAASVPLINGSYPGPTLRGAVGQTVKITVINQLVTDTTTVHWHGVLQTGTPYSDGVPGTSQCGIPPGDSYDYEFELDHAGTLWYHSHAGAQMTTVHGAIIISGDEADVGEYDEDRLMILGDNFHEDTVTEIEGLLSSTQFRWVGSPDTLLINGKGVFEGCESEECAECNATANNPYVLNVDYGKIYRLRFVGAAGLAMNNIGFEMHKMTIVEVETTVIKPLEVEFLDVGGGQTYSVFLKTMTKEEVMATPNNNGNFWIPQAMRFRGGTPQGYGILRYPDADMALPNRTIPENPEQQDVEWSLNQQNSFFPKKDTMMPEKADRRFVLLGTQHSLDSGRTVISINNVSYVEPPTPVILAAKYELEEMKDWVQVTDIPTPYNYSDSLENNGLPQAVNFGSQIYQVKKGEVIDFVFQNSIFGSLSEQDFHPWHLHLHDFWVLGFGNESVWTEADEASYRTPSNALIRNTVGLYPDSWTAIRVKFNNPGAARFHCHIEAHFIMGMGFTVLVGDADDIPNPPSGIPFCGTISKMVAPPVRNPFVYGGGPASGDHHY